MRHKFDVPSFDVLSEFFGVQPKEVDTSGLFRFYVDRGTSLLEFSCNEVAASIETRISVSSHEIMSACFEGARYIEIRGDKEGRYLYAAFAVNGMDIGLQVRVDPEVYVRWGGILE